jgi:hypothetical protein
MANNAALIVVLRFSAELILACRTNSLPALSSFLETESPPRSFLAITSFSLRRIRERLESYPYEESQTAKAPNVSEFNRHVLQGFAQALADLAWPERSAQDFDGVSQEQDFNGPPAETVLSRLSRHELSTLQSGILQHYLANIFQHVFVDLSVRDNVRGLDPSLEADLRLSDARGLVEYAMQLAEEMGEDRAEPEIVAFSLDQAIEKALARRK